MNEYTNDPDVLKVKAKPSPAAGYTPEVLRCRCGFTTTSTARAWVHSSRFATVMHARAA